MKTNIDKAINEANISIHNVNQLFSFGDFICFGDFILLWATLFSRRGIGLGITNNNFCADTCTMMMMMMMM